MNFPNVTVVLMLHHFTLHERNMAFKNSVTMQNTDITILHLDVPYKKYSA